MNAKIFLKRRPSAKRRAFPCPNCGKPIAPCHADSIAFIAAMHGTSTDCCLRCTLDEVELIDTALYDEAVNRSSDKAIERDGYCTPLPALPPELP